MLDRHVRPIIDPILKHACHFLYHKRYHPNQITWVGFGFGLMSFLALAGGFYLTALVFVCLNRVFDGLDGVYARFIDTEHPDQDIIGQSDFGGYLDIVLDFIFYAGFVFFFALSNPSQYALASAFLIFSFIGSGCSFLTYAIIAAKRNITDDLVHGHKKTFYYLSGLTEGTETIICFACCCLFPDKFNLIAYIFGGLCWITTITRIMAAKDHFEHYKKSTD